MSSSKARLLLSLLLFSTLLAACGSGTVTLTVINNSSADWCQLYLAPSSDSAWGADWLNGGSLNAGESRDLSDLEPGQYDIQIVPCDESSYQIYERVGMDLSSDYELTIFDE